ncbi:hypothetical protein K7X08_002643 [Anisodus acutangulus]|uniref:Uncharacterized protein n=1 Tax=Anisodus acutangulus TaxID=402998 RepID=A0A9Q1LTA4_9SOLA|nr:hypothetical protein K7X08_002643 [Anisodus acutangulus]
MKHNLEVLNKKAVCSVDNTPDDIRKQLKDLQEAMGLHEPQSSMIDKEKELRGKLENGEQSKKVFTSKSPEYNEVPNRLISGHTLSSFCRRVEVSEITTTLPKLHSSSNDMNLETSNILENVELFKADVKQIYSRKLKYSIPSYFPMIDELCFVNFLFRNLDEVLNSNWSLESLTKPEIRTLCMKLSHLRSFIRNGERRIPDELWRRSISATYEVERLLTLYLSGVMLLDIFCFHFPVF